MLAQGESLSEDDLTRLATLHVAGIEDSIPSFLGSDYARHLYRFLATSDCESILVERNEGRIASACVVSLEPNSVQSRIARTTAAALARHAAMAWLRRGDFRRFVAASLRDALRGGAEAFPGPEIVYLFTDAAQRSGGLGRRLIERADAFFRDRGHHDYYVQTIDAPENRAIAFYERNGFSRAGTRRERDRRFVLFHRKLEG